jgi:cell fate regulator YaaT (PSP1 superfamily)
MGCGQCSSGGCGSVKAIADTEKTNHKTAGCSSGGCSSGGCTKLNTFDWLSDMALPSTMRYNVVEVKFKGGRKEYFRNTKGLDLYTGDFVACQMPSGFHLGTVSLQGELVRLQLIKKGISDNDEIQKVLRKATEQDIEKHQQAINRDLPTMYRVRELLSEYKLKMKLSDVEYQSDNSKAIFYYSSEDRVDFRELIKVLASEFRVRIDMRQISMRQEASRIGGIGSCGRELCCSTWLTDFKSISTSAARYQNLSLNPAKLSGQCGRLKCCLNYELETYVDALQDIPKVTKPLFTEKGEAFLQKTDIFRRLMWFGYKNDNNWYSIPTTRVVEIMEMNKAGKKPVSLEDLNLLADVMSKKEPINNELDRLDKKLASKPSKGKKKKPNPQNRNTEGADPNPNQNKKRNPNQRNKNHSRGQNVETASDNADASATPNEPKANPNQRSPNQKNKNRTKGQNVNTASQNADGSISPNQPKANPNQRNPNQRNKNQPKGQNVDTAGNNGEASASPNQPNSNQGNPNPRRNNRRNNRNRPKGTNE